MNSVVRERGGQFEMKHEPKQTRLPNGLAVQDLATGKTGSGALPMALNRSVLLAFAGAQHGFATGAARYAREHQWHLVPDMLYTGKIPTGWQGDGILSFIGERDDLAKFIMAASVPAVEISMALQELALSRVEGDNQLIGRLAAEHFLERGFRHFAWAPFREDRLNAERYRGFAGRLARANLTPYPLPPHQAPSDQGARYWGSRRRFLTAELERLRKPLAIFGGNDCVAADLINACDEAGLGVPDSVAVLGVDNSATLCESARVPLSSVCQDLEGMGYQAAALLDRLMAGRKPPKGVIRVRPQGVVTRRSTDTVASQNPRVARALVCIREHYANPRVGVRDVLNFTGYSHRQLAPAFRQELRRTVKQEIARVRVERAKELLAKTHLGVAEIAELAGFLHVKKLYSTFRKAVGLTPGDYRVRESAQQLPELQPVADLDRVKVKSGAQRLFLIGAVGRAGAACWLAKHKPAWKPALRSAGFQAGLARANGGNGAR